MRPEHVRQHLDERPFVPFCIHLDDGSVFDIRHPEQVMVTPRRLIIGLKQINGTRVYERTVFCALMHVNRVEPEKQEIEGT